jgi:aspartyl-tRNA(Asn)/glutamyl-tRNA(Gln) amidotransferase subunit A
VFPLSPRLDHVGPLAQSVGDAWALFRVLAGDMHPVQLTSAAAGDVRVKVLRRYFCDLLDDGVRARFEEALETFRRAGMQAVDHALNHAHVVSPVYLKIAPREAFLVHEAILDAMPEKYTTPVRQRLELGRTVSHDDFLKALNVQADLREEVDNALLDCDALVLPTMPIPAPTLGAETVVIGGADYPTRAMTLRNTQLFNLTGHPAISIPCGTTGDGLPVGLQLVGHHGRTDALVRTALACETLLSQQT